MTTTSGTDRSMQNLMEAEDVIPKAKRIVYARGSEARVYTEAQVGAMARSKVREADSAHRQ